ncbi:MAG: UPF0175 family protein [bacterium]|nr:UPF0175 family protein [bacterium]
MGTTLEITVPNALLEMGLEPAEIQRRAVEWLVLSLFTRERISSGKAARLLGIHRSEFLALLRQYGIAFVDLSPDEVDDEAAAAGALVQGSTR